MFHALDETATTAAPGHARAEAVERDPFLVLRLKFLDRLRADIARLETAAMAGDAHQAAGFAALVHKLSASAVVLGFTELGEAAFELDMVLVRCEAPTAEQISRLWSAVKALEPLSALLSMSPEA